MSVSGASPFVPARGDTIPRDRFGVAGSVSGKAVVAGELTCSAGKVCHEWMRQVQCSHLAIEASLTLRHVFSRPLRQTEGFPDSLRDAEDRAVRARSHEAPAAQPPPIAYALADVRHESTAEVWRDVRYRTRTRTPTAEPEGVNPDAVITPPPLRPPPGCCGSQPPGDGAAAPHDLE